MNIMSSNFFKKALPVLMLFFVSVLVSLSFKENPFSNFLPGHDSSMFLYFGKGIEKGLIPYKDMLDHKGPMLWLIEYVGVSLSSGATYYGVYLFELVSVFFTLFFTFKSTKLLSNSVIAIISTLIPVTLYVQVFEGGNLSEIFALPFIMLSVFVMLKYLLTRELSFGTALIVGFSLFVVFQIRANMIAAWIAFAIVIMGNAIINREKIFSSVVLPVTLGFIVPNIIVAAYFIKNGAFYDYINQAFMINLKYSSATLDQKINVSKIFFSILSEYGFSVFFALAIIYVFFEKKIFIKQSMLAIVLFAILNFYTLIISGNVFLHYISTEVPIISLLASYTLLTVSRSFVEGNYAEFKVLSVMIVALLIIPAIGYVKSYATIRNINESFNNDKVIDKAVAHYVKTHTTEKDTIYVNNMDANIYLLSGRYSNSRYFVLPALDYEKFPAIRKEFKNGLVKKSPKFIVVRSDYGSIKMDGIVKSVVRDKYKLVKRIGYLMIYTLK